MLWHPFFYCLRINHALRLYNSTGILSANKASAVPTKDPNEVIAEVKAANEAAKVINKPPYFTVIIKTLIFERLDSLITSIPI